MPEVTENNFSAEQMKNIVWAFEFYQTFPNKMRIFEASYESLKFPDISGQIASKIVYKIEEKKSIHKLPEYLYFILKKIKKGRKKKR